MSWALLATLIGVLALALRSRRAELRRLALSKQERARARDRGSHRARLQYPQVDLSRCIGCGICVAACPEDGVLDIIHGQAQVVHGARCIGHGLCAKECPVGAIALTLGDLKQRKDIPVLTETLEAGEGSGLFLAGEVTGYALIRTAIEHGKAVASEVSRRVRAAHERGERNGQALDLCIVGAGPGGIACALQAKAERLNFVVLEQETLGGTVSKYPRRKLVMTQPVEMPLVGTLEKTSYEKEELIELWATIAREHDLPIRTGEEFVGVERGGPGLLRVRTKSGIVDAHHVCLALGRRGTPRKLGVPGEELPKVAYSLIDASSYRQRRILVVGGGDSAIEAAVGLSEQPGNQVTISYRKAAFFRLKSRNEARLTDAIEDGRLEVLFESQVAEITPDAVELVAKSGAESTRHARPNDEVFVLAGGIPPFQVLEQSGVSFDPSLRKEPVPLADRGTGLGIALMIALVMALTTQGWTLYHGNYYRLPLELRPDSPLHGFLRPSGAVGLPLGIAAVVAIVANLAYLLRRSLRFPLRFGSLQVWMTSHVATGIFALLLALLHSAMAPGNTVGGHALLGLVVLVITGAIGRYFYAFVPRAANGRELALDEIHGRLASLSSEWDQAHGQFGAEVRSEVAVLVASNQWTGSFWRRLMSLVGSQRGLHERLAELRKRGRARDIPKDQLDELLDLARRAHRAALMAAHFEDVRGLLASWRYLHRWFALLMVLLVVRHVVVALRYSSFLQGVLP